MSACAILADTASCQTKLVVLHPHLVTEHVKMRARYMGLGEITDAEASGLVGVFDTDFATVLNRGALVRVYCDLSEHCKN